MLLEETTMRSHLGMTKLDHLMKPKEKPICIGLHTQQHTQKLANMVVGKDGGKPSDEIQNQVYC
jgi:hypothetical protein